MMAEKARIFGDNEVLTTIMNTNNPKEHKRIGRTIRGFNIEHWSRVSFDVVVTGNYYKFTQNPLLKAVLLSTGDKELVEASPYDRIWGVGLHWSDNQILDRHNWKGENLLGKALMRVRRIIRDETTSGVRYEHRNISGII